MRKATLAALICVTLPGTALAVGLHEIVDQPKIEAIQRAVKRNLKDPDSAQFKNIVAVPKGQVAEFVCGLVNARNGFGGYGGFVPFKGLLTGDNGTYTFRSTVSGEYSNTSQSIANECAALGLPL